MREWTRKPPVRITLEQYRVMRSKPRAAKPVEPTRPPATVHRLAKREEQ